jgi:hypothetical protein
MDVCLLWVVFCQVEVSGTGWSLVQRSPTECGVSEWDREASIMWRPWPTRGSCVMEKKTGHKNGKKLTFHVQEVHLHHMHLSHATKKKQAMQVQRNIEVPPCNHCCCGKAISITYSWVCVWSLRYPACNAHSPYCHLWPAPPYSIFPHYLINGTIFEKERYWTQNVCFDSFYKYCLKHFSF